MMGTMISNWPDVVSAFFTIFSALLILLAAGIWFWSKKYINNLDSTIIELHNLIENKEKELKELINKECAKFVHTDKCKNDYEQIKKLINDISGEMETGDEMFGEVSNQLTRITNTLTSNDKKLNSIGRALSVTSKTLIKICEKDNDMDCSDVKKLADALDDSQWKDLTC